MIVRGVRSQSRVKGEQHQQLELAILSLRRENKELRADVLNMEQRLLESQQSKQTYKGKYMDAKQKLEILSIVGMGGQNKKNKVFERLTSPRTKATRIKSASEEEYHSLKCGLVRSEFQDNLSTKPYIPDPDEYQVHLGSKTNLTPATTYCDEPKKDPRLLQNLMRAHEQLERLSSQMEKMSPSPNLVNLENELYRKLDVVVSKLSQMEVRDLQREKERVVRSKEQQARRYNSSMKAVGEIGKGLRSFRVDE